MVAVAKDIYGSVHKWQQARARLANNANLPPHNRKLALAWLDWKEHELKDGVAATDQDDAAIRYTKTLAKYAMLLTNVCYWFPDLKKITSSELEKWKEGFNNDTIKSLSGKCIRDKNDYFNKIVRSHFFKVFLGHDKIVKEVFSGKVKKRDSTVEFIELSDLQAMMENCSQEYQRVALFVLFTTGMRVGTLLNMRKRDFELRHNPKTKIDYFLAHIRKEYTKSQNDLTVPVVIPECNQLLEKYLAKLQPEEHMIPYSYSQIRKTIIDSAHLAHVVTKPNKQKPHVHILRKSTPMYLLNNGYSTDQVKAILGHKPSSTVIDRYVNYLGLAFEKETTQLQNDAYAQVQTELKTTQTQLAMLQQNYDEVKQQIHKMLAENIRKRKGAA